MSCVLCFSVVFSLRPRLLLLSFFHAFLFAIFFAECENTPSAAAAAPFPATAVTPRVYRP